MAGFTIALNAFYITSPVVNAEGDADSDESQIDSSDIKTEFGEISDSEEEKAVKKEEKAEEPINNNDPDESEDIEGSITDEAVSTEDGNSVEDSEDLSQIDDIERINIEGRRVSWSNIQSNKKYIYSLNDKVSIEFVELDKTTANPNLSIEEIEVDIEGKKVKGYDFNTNQQNNNFKANITLPKPVTLTSDDEVKMKYASTPSEEFKNVISDKVVQEDTVTAYGIDHFTVFIITNNDVVYDNPGEWMEQNDRGYTQSTPTTIHYFPKEGVDGNEKATWELAGLGVNGTYKSFVSWTTHPTNRSTNVDYDLNHAGGTYSFVVNQQQISDQSTVGTAGQWSGWYQVIDGSNDLFTLNDASSLVMHQPSGDFDAVVDELLLVDMSEVWVNKAWAGSNYGDTVEAGKFYGINAFDKIQEGVDAVIDNGEVNVASGDYNDYAQGTFAVVIQGRDGINLLCEDNAIIQAGGSFGTGVRVVGSQNITVENCAATGYNHGFMVDWFSENVTLRNNHVYANYNHGFLLRTGVKNVVLDGNLAEDTMGTTGVGIRVVESPGAPTENITLNNNEIINNAATGVYLSNSSISSFNNNSFNGNPVDIDYRIQDEDLDATTTTTWSGGMLVNDINAVESRLRHDCTGSTYWRGTCDGNDFTGANGSIRYVAAMSPPENYGFNVKPGDPNDPYPNVELTCGSHTNQASPDNRWISHLWEDLSPVGVVEYQRQWRYPGQTNWSGNDTRTDPFTDFRALGNNTTEGEWGFRVRARDASGNWTAWSDACLLTYDISTPQKVEWDMSMRPIFVTRETDYTNGRIDMKFTQSTDPNINYYEYQYNSSQLDNGTRNAGTLRIYTDDPNLTCTDAPDYECTWNASFNTGRKNIHRIRAVDVAGNTGEWSNWNDLSIDEFITVNDTEYSYAQYVNREGIFGEVSYLENDGGFAIREKNGTGDNYELKPESNITINNFGTLDPNISVDYDFFDRYSAVKKVDLYYSYNGGAYSVKATENAPSYEAPYDGSGNGTFNINLSDGYGNYCFYTKTEDIADDRALDNGVGNIEDDPADLCELLVVYQANPPFPPTFVSNIFTHNVDQGTLGDITFTESVTDNISHYEYQFNSYDLASGINYNGGVNVGTYGTLFDCDITDTNTEEVCRWRVAMQEGRAWIFRIRAVDVNGLKSEWTNWDSLTDAEFDNVQLDQIEYSDWKNGEDAFSNGYDINDGGFIIRELEKPTSQITNTGSGDTTYDPSIDITYTAEDNEYTEVKAVKLFVEKDGNPIGSVDVSGGTHSYSFNDGNGEYCFYTRAEDVTDDLSQDVDATWDSGQVGNVEDDKDCDTVGFKINYIENLLPEVNITASPGTVTTEQAITLEANISDWGNGQGSIIGWSGDCTGTDLTFTTPSTPGTYNCTFTIEDLNGDPATATIEVTVRGQVDNGGGDDNNDDDGNNDGGNNNGGGDTGDTGGGTQPVENQTPPTNVVDQGGGGVFIPNPIGNILGADEEDDDEEDVLGAETIELELIDNEYYAIEEAKAGDELRLLNGGICEQYDVLSLILENDVEDGRVYIYEYIVNDYENRPYDESERVFGVCELKLENFEFEDIEEAELTAKYTKEWMFANELEEDDVTMFIAEDTQTAMTDTLGISKVAERDIEDKEYVIVDTIMNGLPSVFALAPADELQPTPTATPTPTPAPAEEDSAGFPWWLLFIILLVILAIIIGAIAYKRNQEKNRY